VIFGFFGWVFYCQPCRGGGPGSQQAHRHQRREVFAQPANAHSRLFSLSGQAGGEDVSTTQCRKDCNTISCSVRILTILPERGDPVLLFSYPEIFCPDPDPPFITRTSGDLYPEPGFEL
jgi:hypothetical protein